MVLENLFPTPVAFFKLGRDLTQGEMDFITGQNTRPNMGNTTSTDNFILRNRKMTKLRDFIETSVSEYFTKTICPKHQVSLRVTQSWCNYTREGEFHHKHAHPNSFISGVFYPFANKETDRIYFYKDGFQQIKLPPSEWNTYNSESWWFPVGTGDLVLFPSSLTHMVEGVKGDHTRISLSFNTFPVGLVGEEMDLTGLRLEDQQR
jgi:uncharacterized protein (TIGR02466 family)